MKQLGDMKRDGHSIGDCAPRTVSDVSDHPVPLAEGKSKVYCRTIAIEIMLPAFIRDRWGMYSRTEKESSKEIAT